MINKKVFSTAIVAMFAMASFAQQALFGGNDIVSPEVNNDGTVTFRLVAPKAVRVQITGDFLPNVKVQSPMGMVEQPSVADLTEGKDGVWTYTSAALAPELYSYKFKVNGMDYLDPSNAYINRDIATYTNIFIVTKDKGDKGDLYSVNAVRHGDVSKVWYDSPTLKMKRRMTIYTPAGYDKGGRYPVLYLLHGAGGDEDAWTTLGRAAQLMDNLIAAGKIRPMIVVMPNGNPNCEAAPGEWSKGMYKPSFMGNSDKPAASIEESFPDVIQYVESHYRVLKDKKDRAVCGLSMGGGHSFSISKRYPNMFDYVGLFSAAVSLKKNFQLADTNKSQEEVDPTVAKQLSTMFKANPRLYWIGIGNTDFLYKANAGYRKYLDSKGYKYEYYESDGGHIWRNWRIYLTIFAQKIFK